MNLLFTIDDELDDIRSDVDYFKKKCEEEGNTIGGVLVNISERLLKVVDRIREGEEEGHH